MRKVYDFNSWLDVWKDFPCLILGRGKSTFDLPLADIDKFRKDGGKVMIVTELGKDKEYRDRADAWVFVDPITSRRCKYAMMEYEGVLWTSLATYRNLGTRDFEPLSWVHLVGGDEFCPDTPTRFQLGSTSSFFAAQLAWYAGVGEIYFAGVDLRLLPGGRTHGDRAENQYDTYDIQDMFENQAKSFANMKAFVDQEPDRKVFKTSDWSKLPFEVKGLR